MFNGNKLDKVDEVLIKLEQMSSFIESLEQRLDRMEQRSHRLTERVVELRDKSDHVWQEYVATKSYIQDTYVDIKEQIHNFDFVSLFSNVNVKRWAIILTGSLGAVTGSPIIADVSHTAIDAIFGTEININREVLQQVEEVLPPEVTEEER